MGLHSKDKSAITDPKQKSSCGFYRQFFTLTCAYIAALLTIHFEIIIQAINDALFSGLLSVSTWDHVALSLPVKPCRSHWKIRHQVPQKRWNKRHICAASNSLLCLPLLSSFLLEEQWCSVRLTAPRTTWLPLSNGASITKQERSCLDAPCGHVRPLLPIHWDSGHIYRNLGWGEKKIWALSGTLKQNNSEHF